MPGSLLALSWPGPFEAILLLFILSIPVVVLIIIRWGSRPRKLPPAFPVIPTPDQQDGAGTYRVAGVDRATRQDREIVVEAQSRANAQVKAELDGIVVTRISKEPSR